MGNWNINIQGVGSHHNSRYDHKAPSDADQMAKNFARALKDVGHTIEHATFTSGFKEELLEAQESSRPH